MSKHHRFLLRIPEALFNNIKKSAESNSTSINEHIHNKLQSNKNAQQILIGANTLDISAIKKNFGSELKGIILYGSEARLESHNHSDIDILLVMCSQSELNRDLYTKWDKINLPHQFSPAFSKFPHNTETKLSSLWREIALDGIVLWEDSLKLSYQLGQLRRQIINSSAERKTAHGHPYWVLKKGA